MSGGRISTHPLTGPGALKRAFEGKRPAPEEERGKKERPERGRGRDRFGPKSSVEGGKGSDARCMCGGERAAPREQE